MGQMTVGVMIGVLLPENVLLRDYEDEDAPEGSGLLDRWEKECEPRIAEHDAKCAARIASTPGLMSCHMMDGDERYVPDIERDNDPAMMGFWIAVGASGKAGIPHLHSPTLSLKTVRTDERYARAYRNAKRRWSRFARWARAQGVELGKPRLRLAETEVT